VYKRQPPALLFPCSPFPSPLATLEAFSPLSNRVACPVRNFSCLLYSGFRRIAAWAAITAQQGNLTFPLIRRRLYKKRPMPNNSIGPKVHKLNPDYSGHSFLTSQFSASLAKSLRLTALSPSVSSLYRLATDCTVKIPVSSVAMYAISAADRARL